MAGVPASSEGGLSSFSFGTGPVFGSGGGSALSSADHQGGLFGSPTPPAFSFGSATGAASDAGFGGVFASSAGFVPGFGGAPAGSQSQFGGIPAGGGFGTQTSTLVHRGASGPTSAPSAALGFPFTQIPTVSPSIFGVPSVPFASPFSQNAAAPSSSSALTSSASTSAFNSSLSSGQTGFSFGYSPLNFDNSLSASAAVTSSGFSTPSFGGLSKPSAPTLATPSVAGFSAPSLSGVSSGSSSAGLSTPSTFSITPSAPSSSAVSLTPSGPSVSGFPVTPTSSATGAGVTTFGFGGNAGLSGGPFSSANLSGASFSSFRFSGSSAAAQNQTPMFGTPSSTPCNVFAPPAHPGTGAVLPTSASPLMFSTTRALSASTVSIPAAVSPPQPGFGLFAASAPTVFSSKQVSLATAAQNSSSSLHVSNIETASRNTEVKNSGGFTFSNGPTAGGGGSSSFSFSIPPKTVRQTASTIPAVGSQTNELSAADTASIGLGGFRFAMGGNFLPPESTTQSGTLNGTTSSATATVSQATPVSATSATPLVNRIPRPPSEITGKNVEEIIKEWTCELQERSGKFRKQAEALGEWDRRIISNRNVLIKVESEVAKVVESQHCLERQLELIETHQQEVERALGSMEDEAERLYQSERTGLKEDEAVASRDKMYQQAEFVEREVERLGAKLRETIQNVNTAQGGDLDIVDGASPLDLVVRILNNQLSSLLWIDEQSGELSERIQKLLSDQVSSHDPGFMGSRLRGA